MPLNRRHFMTGAVAAAGVTLMSSKIPTASAQGTVASSAQTPTSQVPGIYRTKVGAMTVTSIFDGGMQMGAGIVLKPNESEIDKLKKKAFITTDYIPGFLNTFVIESGSKKILVDTGAANYAPTTGHLTENLKAAGYNTSDITDVYLTHAHPDHVNGLLNANGVVTFSQAKIRISDEELQFWFNDEQMAKMPDKKSAFEAARKNLGPYKELGKIETFKLGADLGGGVSSEKLPGHTPGHSGFRISDGNEQLLIWGDIVHMQALQFTHPEWSLVFDIDPELAVRSRQKILAEVATDRLRIGGMHLSFPGLGHVEKSTSGYALVPQMWESQV